jgi:replicative DNA helicase
MNQVRKLKDFARDRELIIVCLSQIDRSYDSKKRAIPDLSDVRLPNPVDLSLFDRTCFLNQGRNASGVNGLGAGRAAA